MVTSYNTRGDIMMNYQQMFEEAVRIGEQKTGINIIKLGWKLAFNKRKRANGLCDYSKRTIFLSSILSPLRTYKQVFNTLLHEVAHAICPGDNHGKKWKSTFIKMGGTGERCSSDNDSTNAVVAKSLQNSYRYAVVNTLDNKIVQRFLRKPSRDFSKRFLIGRPETLGFLKVVAL